LNDYEKLLKAADDKAFAILQERLEKAKSIKEITMVRKELQKLCEKKTEKKEQKAAAKTVQALLTNVK
jgi:hypothetical protein